MTLIAKANKTVRLRELAPIWTDVAPEEDIVVRCARAFAEAFRDNPASPTLARIAKAAGCSRNAVRRYLAVAQARGFLALSVHLPKDASLSRELAERFGLVEAIVTPRQTRWDDQESIRSALAPEVMRTWKGPAKDFRRPARAVHSEWESTAG